MVDSHELHAQAFLSLIVLGFLGEHRAMGETIGTTRLGIKEKNPKGFPALNVGLISQALFLGSISSRRRRTSGRSPKVEGMGLTVLS